MSTSLKGKNILVLGLGLHGGAIGTIQWLAKQQATIVVSDSKTKEQLAPSIEKVKDTPNITYLFGNQDALDLSNIDMIIRNPGVPRTSVVLQRARELNIPVEMDSSLFFEYCGSSNIIGITGSKGKTTASAAISAVMTAIDPKTITVGVDGVSPLGELDKENDRPVVFELSSWRLEPLQEKKISPHIAVVTSLYKDHLNTYASYEEYIDTKKSIISNQTAGDIAILNADDAIIRTWEKDIKAELYWFSLEKIEENRKGIWVEGNNVVVSVPSPVLGEGEDEGKLNAMNTPHPLPLPYWERGDTQTVCNVSDIPHTSPHELRNKLPAILIGILHGAENDVILKALKNAPALKHRLQLVRTVNGVDYINDSASTMPDATIAAIESFQQKPLILLLGGNDKALEFDNLAEVISSHKNIKHIIWLPGTATDRMKDEITPHTSATHHDSTTMNEAVQTAASVATEGDTVLLSPGATSFKLFLHEFDRGEAFIEAVGQLT